MSPFCIFQLIYVISKEIASSELSCSFDCCCCYLTRQRLSIWLIQTKFIHRRKLLLLLLLVLDIRQQTMIPVIDNETSTHGLLFDCFQNSLSKQSCGKNLSLCLLLTHLTFTPTLLLNK